jgi:hypothetical protein
MLWYSTGLQWSTNLKTRRKRAEYLHQRGKTVIRAMHWYYLPRVGVFWSFLSKGFFGVIFPCENRLPAAARWGKGRREERPWRPALTRSADGGAGVGSGSLRRWGREREEPAEAIALRLTRKRDEVSRGCGAIPRGGALTAGREKGLANCSGEMGATAGSTTRTVEYGCCACACRIVVSSTTPKMSRSVACEEHPYTNPAYFFMWWNCYLSIA